jgi:prepilin peptidase CpaA
MHAAALSQGLVVALACALLVAAWTDLRRREISNRLNIAIALVAPLFWWASGWTLLDIGIQLAIAAVTFALLLALFGAGLMGGGDVKLLTALALWIPPISFVKLLVVMSIIGGLLTIVCFAWHYAARRKDRIAVPYGIAISLAGLWILAIKHIPGMADTALLGGT